MRHLSLGNGHHADSAMRTPRRLPEVLYQDNPFGNRRPILAAQVHRLSGERPQTRPDADAAPTARRRRRRC